MSTRDSVHTCRRGMPATESLIARLETLNQEALLGAILWRRSRIAGLNEARRVPAPAVISQASDSACAQDRNQP